MIEINLSFQNSTHYSHAAVSELPHENVFEVRGRLLVGEYGATRIQCEPGFLHKSLELGDILWSQACGQWRELAV